MFDFHFRFAEGKFLLGAELPGKQLRGHRWVVVADAGADSPLTDAFMENVFTVLIPRRAGVPTRAHLAEAVKRSLDEGNRRLDALCPPTGLVRNLLDTGADFLDPLAVKPVADLPILSDVERQLAPPGVTGESSSRVVVLCGPSGCGKTYVLKCLAERRPVVHLDFSADAAAGAARYTGGGLTPFVADMHRVVSVFSESTTPKERYDAAGPYILRLLASHLLLFRVVPQWMKDLYPPDSYLWYWDAQRSVWGRELCNVFYEKLGLEEHGRVVEMVLEMAVMELDRVPVAIDEAVVARDLCNAGFVSRDSETGGGKGILGALIFNFLFGHLRISLRVVCAGTAFSLADAATLGTGIGKSKTKVVTLTNFERFSEAASGKTMS